MRHYFFIILTAALLLTTTNSSAKNSVTKTKQAKEYAAKASSESSSEDGKIPLFPATRNEDRAKKIPVPKTEELPHIHHFHKERVRNSKKHHKKFWALSKILLILCHIAILVIAYMHITPH